MYMLYDVYGCLGWYFIWWPLGPDNSTIIPEFDSPEKNTEKSFVHEGSGTSSLEGPERVGREPWGPAGKLLWMDIF